MSAIAMFLLGVLVTLGGVRLWDAVWGFRAQKLDDYAIEATDASPPPDINALLGRRFEAHGLIFDYTGRARSRFFAEIEGAFDGADGTLKERFRYASGETDRREWTIRLGPDGRRFEATAPDVVGVAEGELKGDAIRMTYRLQLPERAGGHVLDVVDWLYLMNDGAVVNRSEMRKFGFKAAELIAVFQPVAASAALPAVAAE